MPDLRRTRKNLKTALAIVAGVDLLAVVVYLSPLVGSAESRRMEMNQLQAELTTKTRQVAPLKDLPHKVVLANKQIADFYKNRFPSQESQIATEFGKLTKADGVTIEQAKYTEKDQGAGGLRRVEMEASLAGSYTSLARFINALERDEMFFIIDSITLGGQQQGPVKLSVRLETYLKAGSSATGT
jgi:type IV pilus assembly protein PilO